MNPTQSTEAFSLSHYLSLAAYHQHRAFSLKSDAAIQRNARIAAYWYQTARMERELLCLPDYDPNLPIWQQSEAVEAVAQKYEELPL